MFEKKCNKSGRFCVVKLDDVYHCGEYFLCNVFLIFIIHSSILKINFYVKIGHLYECFPSEQDLISSSDETHSLPFLSGRVYSLFLLENGWVAVYYAITSTLGK